MLLSWNEWKNHAAGLPASINVYGKCALHGCAAEANFAEAAFPYRMLSEKG
jgi:hypothetical protein